ncbi:MAG: hypothetical protein U9M90_00795 [Patescibacteria group bacterium]|nr:hypothetical protein [Patescibacteria group bacterium]
MLYNTYADSCTMIAWHLRGSKTIQKQSGNEKKYQDTPKTKWNKGFIAAYLLVATAAVTTLLAGLLVFVASSQRRSSDEVLCQQALQLAETGIYFYKWYLAKI